MRTTLNTTTDTNTTTVVAMIAAVKMMMMGIANHDIATTIDVTIVELLR